MKTKAAAIVACIAAVVALGFAWRMWRDRHDVAVAQELAQRMRTQNAKSAKGLELRLWGKPGGFSAILRNASGGPVPVYPPVRGLSLWVTLYDRNGERYDPRTNFTGHPPQTGTEKVPMASHGKTWEAEILLKDLRAEFDHFGGAAYLVARYKLRTRVPRSDATDAEVWSNPVRLP